MWGWGVQLSSLGGVWGGPLHPGAERHAGGGGCLQCPTYVSPGSVSWAVLRGPLTQVGNLDCSGEALNWAQWGWVFLCWGCYFTFHSEARGVTPGRCWLVLHFDKLPFQRWDVSMAGEGGVSGASQKMLISPNPNCFPSLGL